MWVTRCGIAALGALLIASPAQAQDTPPPLDLFAGYSALPANGDDFPRQLSHGIQGTAAVRVTRWMSLVADAAVQFSTVRDPGPGFRGLTARTKTTELFTGPRFIARSPTVDVFAHALVGMAHGDAGEDFSGFSDSALAFGGGGGVDVHIRRRLSLRAQFDLIGSFVDIIEANPRFAVGMALGIGGR
jgi:hypothetical protein